MKIAIYSRKSRFSESGESVENQIQLCKEYIEKHFDNIEKFYIYEDEGFSGGNTDRPQFQLMLKDAKNKKFDVLVCYRLDRVSRNIADFSNLIEELQRHDISFISIKEQFDTSTPLGRAMMYIASVFAQLERETIAERIRDNMHQLAKTGRWLGGTTPLGFDSEPITYIDHEGKQKKMYKLSPIKGELEIVKLIFDKYLEFQSLSQLEVFCLQNNIKTRKGKDFGKITLRRILTNPVYCKADIDAYNYFYENKALICDDKSKYNGKCGLIGYNKNFKKGTMVIQKDISEWIIAIGKHKGIIDGKDWVEVQNILNRRKGLSPRQATSHYALLSGLIRCKKCNGSMIVKYGPIKSGTNKRIAYYVCRMKVNSRQARCQNTNLRVDETDKYVIDELKKLIETGVLKDLDKAQKQLENKNLMRKNIKDKISENEKAIDNLLKQLAKTENETITKYIFAEIEKLDKENKELKEKLENYNIENQIANISVFKNACIKFYEMIDNVPIEQKRNLLQSIVNKVWWDGENLEIDLFDI